MADILTETERAAIEAFQGKVNRVPTGTSGLPYLEWDEASRQLRHPEPEKRRLMPAKFRQKKGRRTGWTKEVAERRKKVIELRQEGLNLRQIAEKLGQSYDVIKLDSKEIKRIAA